MRFLPPVTGLLPLCSRRPTSPIALPSPLMPMMRSEFGLDYTRAGSLLSAFGIARLPTGRLAL